MAVPPFTRFFCVSLQTAQARALWQASTSEGGWCGSMVERVLSVCKALESCGLTVLWHREKVHCGTSLEVDRCCSKLFFLLSLAAAGRGVCVRVHK